MISPINPQFDRKRVKKLTSTGTYTEAQLLLMMVTRNIWIAGNKAMGKKIYKLKKLRLYKETRQDYNN